MAAFVPNLRMVSLQHVMLIIKFKLKDPEWYSDCKTRGAEQSTQTIRGHVVSTNLRIE